MFSRTFRPVPAPEPFAGAVEAQLRTWDEPALLREALASGGTLCNTCRTRQIRPPAGCRGPWTSHDQAVEIRVGQDDHLVHVYDLARHMAFPFDRAVCASAGGLGHRAGQPLVFPAALPGLDFRATPAEWTPFLGKSVSSITPTPPGSPGRPSRWIAAR